MNEKEKKAIKDLKKTIEYYNKRFKENEKITSVLVDNFDVNNLFVLLNLIEKQQAEIEYWKEQAQGYSDLSKQIKEEYEQRLEDYYNEE